MADPLSKASSRTGRPLKAGVPGTRVSLGLRVTTDLKFRLDEAVVKSGRSQSQEVEIRLERSFLLDDVETAVARGMRQP